MKVFIPAYFITSGHSVQKWKGTDTTLLSWVSNFWGAVHCAYRAYDLIPPACRPDKAPCAAIREPLRLAAQDRARIPQLAPGFIHHHRHRV